MSPESKKGKPAKAGTPKESKAGAEAKPKAGEQASQAGQGQAAKAGAKGAAHTPRAKPKLTEDQRVALGLRAEKHDRNPRFRRHEWWRYKKLGGKHAPWRVPRGIHSKTRRHWGYRPPLVSIGYRSPVAARGLHPSGFEEILVHNVEELAAVNKATQAARIGGTVGGRKAEQIERRAAELGIRILNPRQVE